MPNATGGTRVLRVITRLNVGGPARHVTVLAAGMRGFDTTLVTGLPDPAEGDMGDLAQGLERVVLPTLRRNPSPLDDLRTLWALWRLCRRLAPDIVHTHMAKAGALGRLAARLAGVPVVLHTFHGHVLHGYFPAWQSKLLVLAERLLGKMTTRIYAVSPAQRDELAALGVAQASKLRVLPLGLDLAPLAGPLPRGGLRKLLGLPADAVLIGCVARLAPIKAHDVLLEAFSRIPGDAHLVLIGDGPLRAELEKRRTGRIHLTGWIRDLPMIYGDLDLAVLASRNEGLPVSLIEAAAAGVPIVATRVGGVGDLLGRHPAATLVPPGDPEAFAKALSATLDNLLGMKLLARDAAPAYRARYDQARLLADLTAEYELLLDDRKAPL